MKMKEFSELGMDELLTKRRDLRQESLHLHLHSRAVNSSSQADCAYCGATSPELKQSYSQRAKNLRDIDYGRAKNLSYHQRQRSNRRSCRAPDAHRRGGFQQYE